MAVKYFDKDKQKWVIFPGTVGAPGKNAYQIATEFGYKGTYEEYSHSLYILPECTDKIENADNIPTDNSANLVLSGGVYNAIKNVSNDLDAFKTNVPNTYVTKDELDSKGYLTDAESITHSELENELKKYSLKEEIPSLNGYATESWVKDQNYLTTHQDISNLASKTEVANAINTSKTYTDTEIAKLSNVYDTKGTAQNLVNELNINNYVSKSELTEELNKMQYATKADLDEYVKESELPEGISVVDNLTSTSTTSALSANQGKVLNDKITELSKGVTILSTTGGTISVSSLNDSNPFGVVIVPHGTTVTFTGSNIHSMIAEDESDGSYDMYCVMYANGNYFVNMGVYN